MNRNKFFYLFLTAIISIFLTSCSKTAENQRTVWTQTKTFSGINREYGEPFGLAFDKKGNLYVSDGDRGKIWRVDSAGKNIAFAANLGTPSGIAFDKDDNLYVADSEKQIIWKITPAGEAARFAGIENQSGYADGDAAQAMFNAPIGIAVQENKVYVADTYNDKIRVIENGKVTTLAGSSKGFADGLSTQAKFDTPTGLAVLTDGSVAIADLGNRKIRRIDSTGNVTTLAGNDKQDLTDGYLPEASFVAPTALTVDKFGTLYIADGNSIRALGGSFFAGVKTISDTKRGYADGDLLKSRFNRPSGLAVDAKGNLFVADSENQTLRVLSGENVGNIATAENIAKLRYTPEEFRTLQPPRWTYNPPDAKRDVAGTLGEIRGELTDTKQAWFHNGLDIAGNYGETARFVRTEKILQPVAAEGFGGLRERLRLPTMGYIHIRLGRDSAEKPFEDKRFQFLRDASGKLNGIRVPRGAKFEAGEPIGTLNSFNHVHLIAGHVGAEMNALDALLFPNISDKIAPTIEKVGLFNENWSPIETPNANQRIKLQGKTRIVIRAYDQMDGNNSRRRLGVYRLGYQLLRADKSEFAAPKWTISFDKMPDESFVPFVYAKGSKAGYTPETVFDYTVTNEVEGDLAREGFFEPAQLEAGNYILRVMAADFFGNQSIKDLDIEIIK